ncbi:ketopantoate reductase family protein [Oceanithermus sp.]
MPKSWRAFTGATEYDLVIVGPGALGRAFAALVSRRARVALVARDGRRAERLRRGYTFREPGGGESVVYPEAFGPEEAPPARWGLLLVKAADTARAARVAARLAGLGVVSLQNGWVEDLFPPPPPPVIQGATTAAAKVESGVVSLVSPGRSWLPAGFEELAELLSDSGLPAAVSEDLLIVRLRKLAVNLVINPLTAVLNRPNGALLEPQVWELGVELVREMEPVLNSRGLADGQEQLLQLIYQVARETAANVSSMLADVRAGRKTEIEAITGVLLRWGEELGLELPRHRALYHLVRSLEQIDRGQPLQ